jgi:Raf kinase inhibitor-like YbhB/YbcL family protein
MRVTSPAFEDEQIVPVEWCTPRTDELPRLEIDEVPPEAVTLVALLEDPDSPLGTVTHWLVWNIPPDTRYLDPSNLPPGATTGLDTFGGEGEMGPPPAGGRHRYRWVILALDDSLSLPPGSTRTRLEKAFAGHVLDRARLSAIVENPDPDRTGNA